MRSLRRLYLGLARSTGGGGLFPANRMQIGMGFAQITTYSGYYPFSNILWNGNYWSQVSGTGAFTQNLGELAAAVPTDTFRLTLSSGHADVNLPDGVYTVLNPDGCEIGVGGFSSPDLTGFVTSTSFTFTKSGSGLLCLHCKGSVTNIAGPIRIIMPGQLSAFNAGDYWNPEFITFISGLNMKCLRFMDMISTYRNMIEDWTDQHDVSAITFISKFNNLGGRSIPYDLLINLANRLNIDPWISLPVRITTDYVDSLATYFAANLNSNLKVYLELGNETWNYAAPFNDARVWMELYTHTRYVADVNVGINGWTRTAHGMSTDDLVSQFFTPENFTVTDAAMTYPQGFGETLKVEVVDANTFRLRRTTDNTVVNVTAATPKLIYKRRNEVGKVISSDTNQGIVSKTFWDRWAAIFPRSRTINVMPTQLVLTSVTTNRLAPSGVAAATDAVAVAHYYQGDWWVACVDIASGQFTPKAWSRYSGGSVRVAVYANGSTPTLAEVMAGSGTGYIGHRDIAITSADADNYTSAAAITGLSNGTTYAIRAVLTGQYGFKWMASGTATASASVSTVGIYDSDENMAKRARYDTKEYLYPYIELQQAASGTLPIIAYECGSDYFGGNISAALVPELHAWRTAWTQTTEAGDVLGHFYTTMAAGNMKLMNHYVDINSDPGVFNLVENFSDTSDPRYIKFAAYNGQIAKGVIPSVDNILSANIATEPSYPTVVETFPDDTLTYSIYNGDDNGNYAIVGNELRIVNGTGINWTVPTNRILTIEAANDVTTDYFTVSFATGDAWYQSDAKFAWNSIDDSDSAAINPVIGSNLTLTGTAATIASGLWDMGEVGRYAANPAMISTLNANDPILIAAVLDKDNHSATFRFVIYAAGGLQFFGIYNNSSNVLVGRWNAASTTTDQACAASNPTGKHVYWSFYDADPTTPKIHSGIDQTEFGTGTARSLAGTTFTRELSIGGIGANQSNMKHGSTQLLNRTGMTLADAKAIVQKMQTLHGI